MKRIGFIILSLIFFAAAFLQAKPVETELLKAFITPNSQAEKNIVKIAGMSSKKLNIIAITINAISFMMLFIDEHTSFRWKDESKWNKNIILLQNKIINQILQIYYKNITRNLLTYTA